MKPIGRIAVPSPAPLRGEAWTARTVGWYERANARSDYAERVLGAAADLVKDCRSALDVGAGFGALALPLAHRLERVTALEPSPPMADALAQAVRRDGLANVTVVRARWDAGAVEPHDLVVCAHVGPLLGRGATFLAEVGRVARRGVLVVRDAPGGDDKFFYPELYPRLLGRPWQSSARAEETRGALRDLGIEVTATTIEYRSDQPFETLDEACEFWMTWMGLEDAGARTFLHEFLARRLVRDGRGWLAPYRKRATVMFWSV
ncbi:MAG: class I SAM-dependent methyltransferase [Candidatus Rokubacteria bacterium]|nr:class I SAM-dependent methyltransferase [Candidatus Rokubacteria bacterium]